ncbi:MAG: alpha/beta hydrolase [Deltaproteobacteria bacterium]
MLMVALKGIALIAGLALVVHFGTQTVQQRLLYFPDTRRTTPDEVDLPDVQERELVMGDGARVLTWWGSAKEGQPTLLYFHGNGGSIATRSERIRKYMAHGYGIVMMTYRGFGGSTGVPSERANISDAKEVYDALRASGVPASEIVVYGESLGTGVATQLAAEKEVAGLILDAPYTSIVDLAALHYPHLPARWLMTDRYESLSAAGGVTAPVLIVHGEADDVIPVEMGRQLAAALKGAVQVATFPGAGHSDHYMFGSYDVIYAWLARQFPNKPAMRIGPAAE